MPRVRSAARQFVDPSEQPSHFRDFRLGVLPKAVLAEGAPALDVCTLSGAATFVGSSVGDTYLELQQGAQIALAFPELGERTSVQSYTFTLDVFCVRRSPLCSALHPDATIGIGRLSGAPPNR